MRCIVPVDGFRVKGGQPHQPKGESIESRNDTTLDCKARGLTIPLSILLRADEVIECGNFFANGELPHTSRPIPEIFYRTWVETGCPSAK